jgi:ubiquinone/menaquinone biosynthesis C-methylase UbiE
MRSAATLESTRLSSVAQETERLQLQCPVCRGELGALNDSPSVCSACGFTIEHTNNIYRALPPESRQRLDRFIREYQLIREKEGRGSSSADYYLALPFRDLTGRNSWQWSIRARTYLYFEKNVLPKIATARPLGADVLDVGAGNGWLSYQLALKGHHPVAVDLADNAGDGLGAAHHYTSNLEKPFPCFQAEMDRLPFASNQFDAVIFNASFHYSTDYEVTLREAVRCLRNRGYLIIADSPYYRRTESGQQMLKERREDFIRKFGFPSDSVESQEYLTPEILASLSQRLSLKWHVEKPWYGLDWALRPVKAWIHRKREPSKFYLLWARVER